MICGRAPAVAPNAGIGLRAAPNHKGWIMKPTLTVVSCMFALLALHAGFLRANDAPASKSVPATTAPAVNAAVGDEVIPSCKSFLGLLRDSNDDAKAYACMSADFRKEHTADEFKQALDAMRSGSTLPNVFSVSGEL